MASTRNKASQKRKQTGRQNRVRRQRARFNPTPVAQWTLPSWLTIMRLGLLISLFVHVVFISLHFEPEDKKDGKHLPALEVTLVNTKTETKPKDADALAQFNLNRGGNTDLDKQVTSPLPATQTAIDQSTISAHVQDKGNTTAKNNEEADQEDAEFARLKALEKQAQTLMIQLRSTAVIDKAKREKTRNKTVKDKTEKANKQQNDDKENQRAQEIKRLEALIAKEYEAYQKRPKRKFFGGRVKESKYAKYYDALRHRIETVGTANYPLAAKELKLYGKLVLTFSIKKDGQLEKIEIDKSSGYRVLDAAATRTIEMSAPFTPFPPEIRKETDIIHFTRTMLFTKESVINLKE